MSTPALPSTALAIPAPGVFGRLSPRARALFLLGAAALIAVVSAAWLWSSSPSYGVLFTNVADRDGGAILAQLSQMNIPYRTSEGGTIMVPADKVHEARLKLATQGLPKGSIVGFEILENQKFGLTQFQEQLNYQRGLEGELARSIQTLAPVSAARVHLALPKASGFLREKEPPTASVLLQLHPGQALDRAQVAGIVHLVASSVPELNPKNVSVVDQHGNLLASEGDEALGLNSTQLDYLAQIESTTIKRIEDILEPIVGRGNVRAQVTADVDFSSVDTENETYTPNQGADRAAIRSQSTNESVQPGPDKAQGIPGALSNQPPVPATAPINGQAPPLNPAAPAPGAAADTKSTHKEQTTNYEVDKNIRRVHAATGQIRRLTAAIVVNNKPAENGQGAGTPWDAKEIENLQALARQAMGYDEKRGDTLNLVNAPFSQPELAALEPVPFTQRPDVIALAKEGGKAVLFLLLTGIVVFGVLRPAVKAIGTAPRPADTPAEGAPQPALAAPAVNATNASLEGVRQIAKSDPAAVANVVKTWVGEAKSS